MRSDRGRRILCAGAAAALSVVLGSASPARAADKPAAGAQASPRAEDLFGASAEAYRRGDFKTAIELLQKVYALDPEPSILYNLGRAYEGLGDLKEAVANYKKYLQQQPNARDRGSLEQRITTLERQIAERASLEEQRDRERVRAEQEARERAAKEAELERAKQQQREQRPRRSPVPWVVVGVGVAGIATGTVFALMASGSHSDAVNERQQQKAADLDSRANSQATVANVAFIAGGVLVAGGVTWWWLDGRSKRTGAITSWRLGMGPGFVGAGGEFQ